MGGGRSLRRRARDGGRARWAPEESRRGRGKEWHPAPPTGPGAGGGERSALREDGDVDGSPGLGEAEEPWNWAGRGAGRRKRVSGSQLGSELRPAPRGREAAAARREGPEGAVGWPRSPAAPLAGSPPGEQGKVTWSEGPCVGQMQTLVLNSRVPHPHATPSCFHNFSSSLVAPQGWSRGRGKRGPRSPSS